MTRSPTALKPLLLTLFLAGSAGCVSTLGDADRLYLAGDLTQAEVSYRAYLTSGRAAGEAAARARYRLGLIYALPGSELHDWQLASRALRSLIETEPGSTWGRQAALVLTLHDEREQLMGQLGVLDDRVSALLSEVVELRQAAKQTSDEAEGREARLEQLGQEIAALSRRNGQLGEQLAAKENELARIKRIDLQTPP